MSTRHREIANQLATFLVDTKYPDIPKELVEFTKVLALKTIAGMVAGSTMASSRKISKIIKDRKLPETVGVIGSGFKTALWEAIFLNSFFAHNSELEDDSFYGGSAWDITIIPLLFSLAQHLRLSGKAITEALAVGLEVHVRTCLFPADHLGLGIFPGAIGPAAAAARALRLGPEQTTSALGLAMSGVGLSFPNFGTDAHYFESALQSLQGIMAAEMAKEGMTSNPDIATYLSNVLGKDNVFPDKIVESLGREWLLRHIWVKKYPCCFYTHRQIDILVEFKKHYNLFPEAVEKIEVHISPADEECNRPEPKTLGDLQFSYQHVLACALVDGDVNLSHMDTDMLLNPKYKDARSKVEVISHPDWSSRCLESPAFVTVRTKDGKEFSAERQYPIGSLEEPLSMDQVRELYSKFTRTILSENEIRKTADAVLNLEKLHDVEELMDILTLSRK